MRVPVALVALACAGCAYSFTYGGAGPDAPTRNIRVEPLVDETAEGWPASLVTNRLRRRLGTPDEKRAMETLEGVVLRIESGNIPVVRPGGPAAGLSVIVVRGRARLRDAKGAVILDVGERAGSAELMVGSTVSQTEDVRRLALERASEALADQIADAVIAP